MHKIKAILQRKGPTWRIGFDGVEGVVKHSVGLIYLEYLIRNRPRRFLPTQVYRAAPQGRSAGAAGKQLRGHTEDELHDDYGLHVVQAEGASTLLDATGVKLLENRLLELRRDRELAVANTDQAAQDQVDSEVLKIHGLLKTCTTRIRGSKTFSSPFIRVRDSVKKAIQRALQDIEAQVPALRHFISRHLFGGRNWGFDDDGGCDWTTRVIPELVQAPSRARGEEAFTDDQAD